MAAAGAALAAGGAASASPLHDALGHGHGDGGQRGEVIPASAGNPVTNSLADPGTSLR
ncbi:hypothetical protein [Streptomyces sp. NPDC051776]|uniref:hypothetical protein n=1 Tax=Streptomyces sp. NPDC051776 TaxID=3155414 RepID=UPI00342C1B0E